MDLTTTTAATRLKARIERILKQFTASPELPDYNQFVSGINSGDDLGAIDDGEYDDPTKPTNRPDFVQKELNGWE